MKTMSGYCIWSSASVGESLILCTRSRFGGETKISDGLAVFIRRGGITTAGNTLARRVLIEGAWTYRMPARLSRKLHNRNEKLPPAIRDIAWKGQMRSCSRYRRLAAAGKPKVVVTTAIAREMVGFIWAIAGIAQPALG
jgi:transposase